ncbi:MAG: hypothetical protein ABFS19_03975 [Thermodesulfobacteriota bacterium]
MSFRRFFKAGSRVIVLLLAAELLLQGYHYFFFSSLFLSRDYLEAKGKPQGGDFSFRLNKDGFKDIDFSQKTSGRYRIVAVGDSFAFSSVPYEKSFLTLLEEKLQRGDEQVELLNMGIPSIGPQDYLSLLYREGLKQKPDMVLLSLFIGDDFSAAGGKELCDYSALCSLGQRFIELTRDYPGRTYHGNVNYCDNCPILPKKVFLAYLAERAYLFDKRDERFGGQLENLLSTLKTIRDLCAAENVRLVVLLLPSVIQFDRELGDEIRKRKNIDQSEWDLSRPNRSLGAELEHQEITFFDLLPPLTDQPHPLYKVNDVHWNLNGNQQAADIVSGRLAGLIHPRR